MTELTCADTISRFTFDDCAVRGEHVLLDRSYQELLAIHHYPPVVAELLGELCAAACLLAETIKFDGLLTLQIRSEGEIPLIMAEVTNQQSFRAIARQAQQASSRDFQQLFTNGQLVLTIQPKNGKPYRGIVMLDGNSLASSIGAYFAQSEQLETRLWLHSDGQRASGFLLQQLPGDDNSEQWQHLSHMASTLTQEELLNLPRETVLYRLYHEESVRLHPEKPVQFQCTCTRERLEHALISLGEAELRDIIEEKSVIDANCEFCNRFYSFTAADVDAMFGNSSPESHH